MSMVLSNCFMERVTELCRMSSTRRRTESKCVQAAEQQAKRNSALPSALSASNVRKRSQRHPHNPCYWWFFGLWTRLWYEAAVGAKFFTSTIRRRINIDSFSVEDIIHTEFIPSGQKMIEIFYWNTLRCRMKNVQGNHPVMWRHNFWDRN
jgi:hypothetical protein